MSRAMGIALGLIAASTLPAQPPKVLVQNMQSHERFYFHVRFEWPKDMLAWERLGDSTLKTHAFDWARLPQLIPADNASTAIYPLVRYNAIKPEWLSPADLEFVGILNDWNAKTPFKLRYPVRPRGERPADPVQAFFDEQNAWKTVDVEVSFASRKTDDDLKRWWAYAKAGHFAVLERQTPEFGFFGFARAAAGRLHGFAPVPIRTPEHAGRDFDVKKLYEITTGAESITEALALHRMRGGADAKREPRDIPLAKVTPVNITDHPWKQMIGDKKPAPEPLARLVPHDNYYVRFANFAKFLEAGDLLDELGTPFRHGWETHAREYRIKQKLEQQVCLKTGPLSRLFGPALVKELAITGSDPYFREGTDVTLVFHVTNAKLFLQHADVQLQEARVKFGARIQSSERRYQNVAVESHVTPRREVSLHRAALGDFVVVSNSPRGLERVLDVHQGRIPSLGDALDFRYMRTVFRADDKGEDVFAFMPDDFIRNLVGPATRIKERRRLEALTSLHMATNAALFTAWDFGKLPKDHADLLTQAALKQSDLYTPDGQGVFWHANENLAVSDVYGSLHFATPLLEIPIEHVTATERHEYDRFRVEYERLYQRFADPVGIRIALEKTRIRAEIYVLPLVANQNVQIARFLFGGGTFPFDASRVTSGSAVHLGVYLGAWTRGFVHGGQAAWLGQHGWVELDDSERQRHWPERKMRSDLGIPLGEDFRQDPVVVGESIANKKAFDDDSAQFTPPFAHGKRIKSTKYRGVAIDEHEGAYEPKNSGYVTVFPDYVLTSTSKAGLERRIDAHLDAHLDRKKEKPAAEPPIDANIAIHLRPQLPHTRDALERLLAWESQRRALPNANMYQPLRRAGLLPVLNPPAIMRDTAYHWFAFEPVSPDGAPFEYDLAHREYRNARHGSYREPVLPQGLDAKSPLARVLDAFESLSVAARFREDGLHAILTLQKK